MSSIAERLKIFAQHMGSASKLAKELGMTPSSFQSYTSGKSKPGTDILLRLYELGCNIIWLLNGTGEMLYITEKETGFSDIRNLVSDKDLLKVLLNHSIDDLPDTSGFESCRGENREDEMFEFHPYDLTSLIEERKIDSFLAVVGNNTMKEYGINVKDMVVFTSVDSINELKDCVVIIRERYEFAEHRKYLALFLRYYDKESNQLLSGSKNLLPIPYNPELIVPARITSIIRPL